MRGRGTGLLVIAVALLIIGSLSAQHSTANANWIMGDLGQIAAALGVAPKAGVYHVSDILRELAKRTGVDVDRLSGCPTPPPSPKAGAIIISAVLANPPGGTDAAETPNESITFRNVSNCPVDLRGCEFRDDQASYIIPSNRQDAVLDPQEEITFYGWEYNPTSNAWGINLVNTGEILTLSCGLTRIDFWAYPGGSGDGELLLRDW